MVQPSPSAGPVRGPRRAALRRSLPVFGAFVVGAIAYGGLYCFPPLSIAYAADFHVPGTVAVTPWTVFLLVTALSAPILGRAYDVVPDRALLAAGMVLLSAGWLLAAAASDISLLVLAYGVFLALGLELVFVGTTTAMARRYAGVAGLALGIAYAGPGIGVAVSVPIVTALLAVVSWHSISLGFAGVALLGLPFVWLMTSGPAVVVPAAAEPSVAPRRPGRGSMESTGLHETSAPGAIGASQEPLPAGSRARAEGLRRVLRTRRFWILLVGAVGIGCIDEGTFQFFLGQAVRQGIDRDLASAALAFQSLAYVAGQIAGGGLSDRFGRRYVGLLMALLIAAGATSAWAAGGGTVALAFAGNALYGFGIGATIAIRSAAFSDVFGGRNFGAVFGIVAIAYPAGGIVVMNGGALLFDSSGSYWPVWGIVMAALALWTAALLVAGPRHHGLRARLAGVRARLPG